jgi:hypothetical protein
MKPKFNHSHKGYSGKLDGLVYGMYNSNEICLALYEDRSAKSEVRSGREELKEDRSAKCEVRNEDQNFHR